MKPPATQTITVTPDYLGVTSFGERRPLSPAATTRMLRRYPWLRECPEFWGKIAAGKKTVTYAFRKAQVESAEYTHLRRLLPAENVLTFAWAEHVAGDSHVDLHGFVREILKVCGRNTFLFANYTLQTSTGWQQKVTWEFTLSSEGVLEVESNSRHFNESGAWTASPKLPAFRKPVASRRGSQHRGGVRRAWALPSGAVLSLGVHGDLRLWNVRSGKPLGRLRTPGAVLAAELVGETFCYVTASGHLGTYDAGSGEPIWIMDLPPAIPVDGVRRIERLGAAHLAIIAEPELAGEQVYVLGPFQSLRLTRTPTEAEYGIPLRTSAVVGDGVLQVGRVPTLVEPLRGGCSKKYTVAPKLRRGLDEMDRRFCVAGQRVITLGVDAMYNTDANKRADNNLWAWDIGERQLIDRVDVLDPVEGDEPMYLEQGDTRTPTVCGMLGFPSGRVLSWGRFALHLWSAAALKLEWLLPGHWPTGAFQLGGDRLVLWSRRESIVYSWRFSGAAGDPCKQRDVPVLIKAHAGGLAGVCHLGGEQVLTWSETEPLMRVWNHESGRHVRGLGA